MWHKLSTQALAIDVYISIEICKLHFQDFICMDGIILTWREFQIRIIEVHPVWELITILYSI
jgi:hypothetical protein